MSRCLRILLMAGLLLLTGCGNDDSSAVLTETVHRAPINLQIHAEGDLKATESTPLQVPGQQWTPRQLSWVLADGSQVRKDEVVARFSARQSKQDLAEAMLDLKRNTIAHVGKQSELSQNRGQLSVDLAAVGYQLAIANRYANASFEALARNKVLDAVQDKQYLGTKENILNWRRGQSATRGQAELAVLDAQRATFQIKAKQKRDDLDALELRAPHDGIFMLEADWSGQKPHVGQTLYASRPLASLPDIAAMEIEIAVPQVQAQGIKVGDAVTMHPLGTPDQLARSSISWIAAAAQTRSRESPVKYLMMKAKVPKSAITAHAWKPGQRFAVEIVQLSSKDAISVPNLAIDSSAENATVKVLQGNVMVLRKIKLGVRGASRSQVLDGLEVDDRVVLDGGAKALGT